MTDSEKQTERTSRATREGVVVSDNRDKTIKVRVEYLVKHPKYGKIVRKRTAFQVHDEKNEAKAGDRVEITECRPISKTKHWRLLRIVSRGFAAIPAGGA
ncbi:MAG: 30S ribosomal protein S17 [Phycisphaerales bacterium]|nr:30S ribosomal protein S17 [Phycisphaerales bacterium]